MSSIEQPIILADGTYTCPTDGEELAGDGENHMECFECGYMIHELDLK